MALSIAANCISLQKHQLFLRKTPSISSFSKRRFSHVTCAKKFSPRTGKSDSRNRRSEGPGGLATTIKEEEQVDEETEWKEGEKEVWVINGKVDPNFVLPELPGGDEPDFWEGAKWDGLGFFVQYMWAFGIGFALIACGIAVTSYNEGATDFKETPVYKESVQSRDLLEEPEASGSDVFEGNPTEEAPSLD